MKPDVFEGGNWAKSGGSAIGGDLDEVRLLTTNKDFTRNYFTITGDISAATTQIARFAAIIQAYYPDFWPETVQALIVHSAEWTPSMLAQWELNPLPTQTNKTQIQNLIRYCGFGVPDITRALYCSENGLSLIVQSSLYPFEQVDKRLKMRDMNLHNIPWPVDVLEDLGNTPVEMRITLSYFIEPNPGERGWKRRHSYASHGLRFDVNLPTESRDQFRMYINAVAREEEENPNIQRSSDSSEWVLGKDLRHKGSIHSDIWRGTAINLAQRQFIGVYPVVRWWRECPHHKRWNKQARYSLIISITTPAEDVQLYTEIENRISVEIAT